jgi:hypothetical protein
MALPVWTTSKEATTVIAVNLPPIANSDQPKKEKKPDSGWTLFSQAGDGQ